MNNLSNIVITLLPVLGVIIGASLQYFFSRSAETRKYLAGLRTQAYIDYLRCFAEVKHIGRDNPKIRNELLAKATDAKTRIVIYGSSAVIEALTNFEQLGAVLDTPNAKEKFLTLCNAMRQESIGKSGKARLEALKLILFSPEEGM